MTKQDAMDLLGCSDERELAEALNVSTSVAAQWPSVLPGRIAARVESIASRRTRNQEESEE